MRRAKKILPAACPPSGCLSTFKKMVNVDSEGWKVDTPQKSNIDTQNCHGLRELLCPNRHFWVTGNHVSFLGAQSEVPPPTNKTITIGSWRLKSSESLASFISFLALRWVQKLQSSPYVLRVPVFISSKVSCKNVPWTWLHEDVFPEGQDKTRNKKMQRKEWKNMEPVWLL